MEMVNLAIISTAHIPVEEANFLDSNCTFDWPAAGARYGDFGWFFYTDDFAGAYNEEKLPVLKTVLAWARGKGAVYVLLDHDAIETDELPTFDW